MATQDTGLRSHHSRAEVEKLKRESENMEVPRGFEPLWKRFAIPNRVLTSRNNTQLNRVQVRPLQKKWQHEAVTLMPACCHPEGREKLRDEADWRSCGP